MKIRRVFYIAAAVAVMTGVRAEAQTKEEAAMMEDMMKPSPHHMAMKADAGDWVTKAQFWMSPEAPPMETIGTAKMELIMNGLFISEVANSDMMGMPWEGRGVFGYDKTLKKHVGTWFDSMGTLIMHFEGDCDGACKVVTLYSDYKDPMTNSMQRMKSLTRVVDADHRVNELSIVDAKGKETKMGVIEYSRKK